MKNGSNLPNGMQITNLYIPNNKASKYEAKIDRTKSRWINI